MGLINAKFCKARNNLNYFDLHRFELMTLDDDSDSDSEDEITVKMISSKLDDLNTCNALVNNHGGTLQKAISDLVDKDPHQDNRPEKANVDEKDHSEQILRLINEKAQLFRITSNAMINVSTILAIQKYS